MHLRNGPKASDENVDTKKAKPISNADILYTFTNNMHAIRISEEYMYCIIE